MLNCHGRPFLAEFSLDIQHLLHSYNHTCSSPTPNFPRPLYAGTPHLILVSVLGDDALSQPVVEKNRTTESHHMSTDHSMSLRKECPQERVQTTTLRRDTTAHTHTHMLTSPTLAWTLVLTYYPSLKKPFTAHNQKKPAKATATT